MEIERKTHKCQPVNKNILSYLGLFYQEACLIFITTYVTHKHTSRPTPKLWKYIDLYVHYDNQQGLGTLVTLIM